MADDVTTYEVKPTERQIMAVNTILEGETNIGRAMRTAGYSATSSLNPGKNFIDSKGVTVYLQTLDERSQARFKMSAIEKAFDVYLQAMDAYRYIPQRSKNGKKLVDNMFRVRDHQVRIIAADRIIQLTQLARQQAQIEQPHPSPDLYSDEVKDFNQKFLKFLEKEM